MNAELPAAQPGRQELRPAVFLDKDGTLVEDVPFNVNVDRIRFYPEVMAVLARLSEMGYALFVISNQPGIAHAYFGEPDVVRVGNVLLDKIKAHGIPMGGFYYCPHHPEGTVTGYAHTCDCRKPRCGMILRAAREHNVDLAQSWMIGDILDDVEAGNRAGCRTILVDRGNETEWLEGGFRNPFHIARDLDDALRVVCENPLQYRQPKTVGAPLAGRGA